MPAVFARDMDDVDAGLRFEQFGQELGLVAGARRCVAELARIGLRVGDRGTSAPIGTLALTPPDGRRCGQGFVGTRRTAMSYDLDQFVSDCRAILSRDPGPQGREEVRLRLERLLANQDFVRQY